MLLNEVTFAGYAGRDGELRYTPTGTAVGTVSLAHTQKGRDGRQDKTTWMTVTAFGGWSEVVSKIRKGDNVIVKGQLDVRSWEKDGSTHYATSIMAFSVGILKPGDKKKSDETQRGDYGQGLDHVPF